MNDFEKMVAANYISRSITTQHGGDAAVIQAAYLVAQLRRSTRPVAAAIPTEPKAVQKAYMEIVLAIHEPEVA